MTEQQLMDEGMTRAEARKELRAQRNEQRIHSQTNSQAIRTANQISRTVNQYFKKRKWDRLTASKKFSAQIFLNPKIEGTDLY